MSRALSHVLWPLDGISGPHTRYSIRLLRYWFARSLLERLHRRVGRPLNVLEVGVGGDAELRTYIGKQDWIGRWDGLDVNFPRKTELYDDFIEADIEQPPALPRSYDAVLLSHVLEHLLEPEAAMARLADALAPGGALIGGSPTMPATIGRLREKSLRRKNEFVPVTEHRHLSVITPPRIRRFARENSLDPELVTGTFIVRWTGSVLENYPLWIRANMAWGALFPSLGGELYFSLRKR
jgi:SAM-dependent methyltransferase